MNLKTYSFMKMFLSFKEYETENGKLIVDELAEGAEAMIMNENGELVPAADGVYEVEDGKLVIADGKIASIEAIEVEPEPEKPAEEKLVDDKKPTDEPEKPTDEPEKPTDEPASNPELEEANRVIEELQGKLAEAEARIAELEAELNKPAADPLEMKATAKPVSAPKSGAMKYFAE